MTSREIAPLIAEAAAYFREVIGRVAAEDLLSMIAIELGHEQALERYCIHHSNARHAPSFARFTQYSKAIAPGTILHIFGDNDPHAALHSLIRGLLLGSHNFVVLPNGSIPEVIDFRKTLAPVLANEIEVSEQIPELWKETAEAVVVCGDDEFVKKHRAQTPPDKIFVGRVRKLSFAVVFEDSLYESPGLLASDVSRNDQFAEFCPHAVYVNEIGHLDPLSYAKRLAGAMEEYNKRVPRRTLSDHEQALLVNLRTSYQFRSGKSGEAQVWASEGNTDWTVIYEADPMFTQSPLNRVIFVKPLPKSLTVALSPVRGRIGAVGIYPPEIQHAHSMAKFEFPRICPIGRMHTPPVTWHHAGRQNLAPLVRWLDFEQPVE